MKKMQTELEMKTTVAEVRNVLGRINVILDIIEEKTNEPEDKATLNET